MTALPFPPILQKTGKEKVNLIIRADDMGMSHAANLGCLEAYRKILTNPELFSFCEEKEINLIAYKYL